MNINYTDRNTKTEGATFIATEHYDGKNFDYMTVYRRYVMHHGEWELRGTYKTRAEVEADATVERCSEGHRITGSVEENRHRICWQCEQG